MKKKSALVAVGATMLLSLFAAPTASAAGEFCYDVDVVVNGGTVVDESGCQSIG